MLHAARLLSLSVATCALVACKPTPPAVADAGPAVVAAVAADAGPVTPKAPEAPECEKHAKVLAAAMANRDPDPNKGPPPHLRGAFQHFTDATRRACPVETEWKVVTDTVAALDDAHVLYDHTATEGARVLVQDAAVKTLESMTGTSHGDYVVQTAKTKPDDAAKGAKQNAAVRDAWKKWWTTAQNERDVWLGKGKAKAAEAQGALEQQKLAKLMVSKIAVLRRWDVTPWAGPALTPQDVIKTPGFKPEMLQTPVAASLVDAVKWGWYLRKDGVIYRVLRKEDPTTKDWTLDAFKQETSTELVDPKKILIWPLSDKMPLGALKSGAEIGVPPAFVEWLRKDPVIYFGVLESQTFGVTTIEGDAIYLLALRSGVIDN